MINAVMLGAIAGCGKLPIPVETIRSGDPRRRQGGRGKPARLPAGLDRRAHRGDRIPSRDRRQAPRKAAQRSRHRSSTRSATRMPQSAQDIVIEGVRRLTRFQDVAYARLLSRPAARRSRDVDAQMRGDGKLLKETARHLAVRMSFEDVIRVAQAKIAPARMQRIGAGTAARRTTSRISVTNSSSPASRNCARCCRRSLARPHHCLVRASAAGSAACISAWRSSPPRSAAICASGCSPSCALCAASCIAMSQEQAQIESWLGMIARRRAAVARAGARSRRMRAADQRLWLDPHARHARIFRRSKTRLIRPALQGDIPVQDAIDGIASARTAALLDPEGDASPSAWTSSTPGLSFRIAAE